MARKWSRRKKASLVLALTGLATGIGVVLLWPRIKKVYGTFGIGTPYSAPKGAPMTAGCPDGFRLRGARGSVPEVCVSRRGDDQRVFEPYTGKLLDYS